MDLISSRYRKPKGRPTKRRKMLAENSKKRWQKSSKTVDEKSNKAQTKVTTLNVSEPPSTTNLPLLGEREVTKEFRYNSETENHLSNRFYVHFHKISGPLYRKCSNRFQHIFYGSYREVLEEAFSTVEYPEHY
ncbi:hypothetical protein TNCV_1986251 [Trichonephila clavipes]|nr:hypothetical protein TNCV_1986251 [Trichonephila clavipes]